MWKPGQLITEVIGNHRHICRVTKRTVPLGQRGKFIQAQHYPKLPLDCWLRITIIVEDYT